MSTHPEVLKAIAAADKAVGRLPRKWLVCSWQMYRAIREHAEREAEDRGRPFYQPPPPMPGINIYGPTGAVEINVFKGWSGYQWQLCTKAQRDYIFDTNLRGSKKDASWNGSKHTCCNARVWYRHKKGCPLLDGNERWEALDDSASRQ